MTMLLINIYIIYNVLYNIHNIAEQLCMNNIDIAQDKCVSHLHVSHICATCRCS